MSNPRTPPAAPRAELVTIWRSSTGLRMMSIVAGGKVHEFELCARRVSNILKEAAHEMTRDEPR